MLGAGCSVTLLLVCCEGEHPIAEPDTVLFEETFEGPLDGAWSWVREAPEARRIEGGSLFLLSEPGGLFQEENDGRNLLLRDLPPSREPLLVEVALTLRPQGKYENAGIILYVDDDNYAVVNKESYADEEPSLRLQMVYEANGEARVPHDTAYDRPHVILGMRISEDGVTGLYRADTEEPWTVLGTMPRPGGGTPRIGVKTTYGVAGAQRWAEFHHFRIAGVP